MTDPREGDAAAHEAGEPGEPGEPGEVGSVADEAAKLLGALSGWARERDLDQTLSGFADHAAAAASAVDGHVDTGAAECAYCPICRTVHVVRLASPEVKAHLAAAASSLLQAAAGVLASLPQPGSAPGASATPGSGSEFEKIDLDGDDS